MLVPDGVVTVTSTRPQPGGAVTASWVALLTLTLIPAAAPKATEVEPETKPVPVTVTDVEQPLSGHELGLTPVTVGPGEVWKSSR